MLLNAERKTDLSGLDLIELEEYFRDLGESKFRAKQVFRRIHKHNARSIDEFTELSKELREKLKSDFSILNVTEGDVANGGTEKITLNLPSDKMGRERVVEAVWIVSSSRNTICASSQVGCSLNCVFCATGTLPFKGNMSAGEILQQMYALAQYKKQKPTNIVFMGMGEPFHNYANVIRAAEILHNEDGWHLGARHITISTSGVVPKIHQFIDERQPFNLAISLNHPDPKGRREIMDITEKHSLPELLDACKRYGQELKRTITFEYIMIPGVNMGESSLEQLIHICKRLRSKVNLIPLNTTLNGWRAPAAEEQSTFQKALVDAGIRAFNRGSPGKDVNGACGMLALNRSHN